MALSATIDLTASPIKLTVVSDKRVVAVAVQAASETATGTATFPVTITQSGGRTWTLLSDNGTTAVYTG